MSRPVLMRSKNPDAAEPGWATSEFWIAVVGAVAVLASHLFGVNIDPDVQAASVTLIVGLYAVARGLRKMGTGRG